MDKKLTYYDLVVPVIPGVVFIISMGSLLKLSGVLLPIPKLSTASEALVVLSFSFVMGQVVQSMGAIFERSYHWAMGGRPSDQVMSGKYPRINGEMLEKIKKVLCEDCRSTVSGVIVCTEKSEMGAGVKEPENDELFLHALSVARKNKLGNVERYTAMYGYHRTMLTIGLLLLLINALMWVLKGTIDNFNTFLVYEMIALALSLISLKRAKEFGFHFSREVLLMANIQLQEKKKG